MSLTKVSFSMIQGAMINVLDYGAVADGNSYSGAGTDNTAAFQAALDYAGANDYTVFVPAGTYVLRNQITMNSRSGLVGAGMYKTNLIAPTSFTGNGLIYANGAGGPPTLLKDFTIIGQTSAGAGAGSVGIRAGANAVIMENIWAGGFAIQFRLQNSDQFAYGCFADVSLSGGTGFAIEASGSGCIDCETFNCYVGFNVNNSAGEADPNILLSNCKALHSKYSGFTIDSSKNVSLTNCVAHSPNATDFNPYGVIVTGGQNISIVQFMMNLGTASSTASTGIYQVGVTTGLTISSCQITDVLNGIHITDAQYSVISNNILNNNRKWGIIVDGGSPSLVITGNSSWNNGITSATDGGGYWLTATAASQKWTVNGNSAGDSSGSISKYGFYIDCNASATVNFIGNAVSQTASAYTYTGTTANVKNQSTNY